jgi:hypothetical protein
VHVAFGRDAPAGARTMKVLGVITTGWPERER